MSLLFFFFNYTSTTEIYTLSLHDALPIYDQRHIAREIEAANPALDGNGSRRPVRDDREDMDLLARVGLRGGELHGLLEPLHRDLPEAARCDRFGRATSQDTAEQRHGRDRVNEPHGRLPGV